MKTDIRDYCAFSFVRCLFFLVLINLGPFLILSSFASTIDKNIEQSIVDNNWDRVINLIDKMPIESQSPVHLFLKGHAYLSMNRNNESVSVFFKISLDDLKQWVKWSEEFVLHNNKKSIAHYFIGDAYSRIGDFDKALKYFYKSMRIDKNNYLSSNAIGVVLVLLKKYKDAREELSNTIRINYNLVDAYNNMGMLRIRQGQGRIGAAKKFRAAIRLNPNFALAYHGLGCLELLKAQYITPEENGNITKALELLPDAPQLLIENEARFVDAFLEQRKSILVAVTENEGTTLKREFSISQLSNQYRKYEQKQTSSDANIFQRSVAGFRAGRAQIQLSNLARDMSQGDMKRLAERNPRDFGALLNAVSSREKDLKVQKNAGGAFHEFNWNVNSIIGAGSGTAARYLDRMNNHLNNRFEQRYNDALKTKRDLVNVMDHKVKSQINAGTYEPVKMPESLKTTRGNHSININNLNKIYPGQKPSQTFVPQGATTDRANVTWDDHEWPFIPIFGLLYPVPQSDS